MIIRSQDRKSIINFDSIDTVRLSKLLERGIIKEQYQTDIFYDSADTFGVLGTYSSEEKAIKVLDMIQEAYCGMRSVDCTTRGMLDTFAKREDVSCLLDLHIDKYFFQMPKDSEV